jgi:hypothetical protein
MRVTSLARRLGAATLVLTMGVGLASCSGDNGSSDSGSATDAGSDAGTDESTHDESEEETEHEDEASDESPAELSAADFYPSVMAAMQEAETFTFEIVTEAAGQAQTMTGEARLGDEGVQMHASGSGAQAMELILVEKSMYMKSADLGTGDKWLKIDLSDPNSLFGMLGKATDPAVMLKAMEAPKKLELVGSEELDGVATNHYRITLDPAQYLEAMDFPAAMTEMMPKELVTEMWVDADDLPRQFEQTMEVPGVGGGKPTTSTTHGTYSDFGTDVEIEAPPAGEVTEQPGM